MSDFTERFSEVHNSLIDEGQATLAPGVYDSAWVVMANYHRGILILKVLAMGAGATLDQSVRQATTTAGAGAAAIAGKAFTQLTQAGGDVGALNCMELRTEELNVTGGFDCVSVRTTVAVANVVIAYQFYGRVPRFPPVGVANWNEVIG